MKKRIRLKSKKLQELFKKSKRKDIRKDFFELLRRAIKSNTILV